MNKEFRRKKSNLSDFGEAFFICLRCLQPDIFSLKNGYERLIQRPFYAFKKLFFGLSGFVLFDNLFGEFVGHRFVMREFERIRSASLCL